MDEAGINPELAGRLKRDHRLPREPTSLEDYFILARATTEANPQVAAFFERMRRGQAVMGETPSDRGYSVSIPERAEVNVMCGYDAVVTAVLRAEGEARGACPHCGAQMRIRIRDGHLAEAEPETIVFWLGTGPAGARGHPLCDHLHLFP
ncbi:MAG: organomercurial lyase, partial [Thermoplasmata archaeon]|nr:organomercurial lyase [Thermoplasmata archaeon]